MNERVAPGLCSYYFSARFKKNCPRHFRFVKHLKKNTCFWSPSWGIFGFSFFGQAILVFSGFASNTSREKKYIPKIG